MDVFTIVDDYHSVPDVAIIVGNDHSVFMIAENNHDITGVISIYSHKNTLF